MGLFDTVGDFLALLFSKDPAASRVRKELREIRGYLKTVKPPVYKASGNNVLPGFASSVFGLYSSLQPVRELLERSCLAADQRIVRRFRDVLIERRLGAGSLKLLESCSYESMRARSGDDYSTVETAVSSASEDFRVFRKALEGQAAVSIEAELADFERLSDLCRFDFIRLLGCFDGALKADLPSYKPRFSAVHGPSIADDLADLHSVVAIPPIGPSVFDDLLSLADRVGGGDSADLKKRLTKSLTAVSRFLVSNLSSPTLTALLRAVREDPRYAPPVPAAIRPFLPEYRDQAERRFREDRDRLLRESRERSLSAEIAELFGDGNGGQPHLSSVAGFDAELDDRMKAVVSRSFAWMTPLTLLKNFEQRYLAQGLIEATRRLTVEGFFSNGAVRSRLTDALARLEKSGERIAAFEESIGGPGRGGAAALRKLLDEAATGKDVVDVVDRLAKGLDERAKDMVERDVAACRMLAEIVYDVIGDFRKPMPELVTNIKTLASSKSKNLIPALADGYNAIARLLKIMRAYLLVSPMEGQ